MAGGVLGLDLAKTTGVAWAGPSDGSRRPWEWWTLNLNPSGALRGDHYFSFQKQLDDLLRKREPDLVVFEEVDFAKYRLAFQVNARLSGIVIVRCEAFGIPYVGVSVKTLKKYAGNGNADKEAMRRFAREKLFGPVIDRPWSNEITSDEIDALWLVQYGLEQVGVAA